ncbi:hypothetical protein bcgnr5390_10570 [Bacillus luti]|nr:hypothetical protein BC2903_30340 [Bacillus cereus]
MFWGDTHDKDTEFSLAPKKTHLLTKILKINYSYCEQNNSQTKKQIKGGNFL